MKNLSKILIIVALIIIIAVVITFKNQPSKNENETGESSGLETVAIPLEQTKDLILSEQEKEGEPKAESNEQAEIIKERRIETLKSVQPEKKLAEGDVLDIVEGEEITEQELESEYKKLSPQYRDMFKNDKDLYLEQLVIKQLLVQKATEKGYIPVGNTNQSKEDTGIQKLISELGNDVDIADSELEQFYQENKGQMQGAAYEEVKNDIRNYLVQQKQGEHVQQYIDQIRQEADVVLNEDWIARQVAAKPKNPLTDALKNGLPTVLDLGSDSCVPCQMMMPIFAELEKELEGKANVILLQIADYRDLSTKYKVRVIPTQIFFDQNGGQYWRHEGYLSKEDILKKLRETGAEL